MAFSRHFHLPGGTVRKKLLPFSGWVREDFNFFEIFKQKKTKKKHKGHHVQYIGETLTNINFLKTFFEKRY